MITTIKVKLMAQVSKLNMLRIVQWNAKSVLPRRDELAKHCGDFNIIMISETWLSADKTFKLRGFDTVRRDRENQSGGGVLLLICEGIKYKRI